MRVMLSTMLAIGLGLVVSAGTASAQGAPPGNATSFGCFDGKAQGGCGTCGTDGKGKHHHLLIGRGTEMPVGCACCDAQKTFLFGSCNQFYGPGNDCRRCGIGRGNCHAPVGGPPYPAVPPCTYSSYTNR